MERAIKFGKRSFWIKLSGYPMKIGVFNDMNFLKIGIKKGELGGSYAYGFQIVILNICFVGWYFAPPVLDPLSGQGGYTNDLNRTSF